jgi:hypothetical protein
MRRTMPDSLIVNYGPITGLLFIISRHCTCRSRHHLADAADAVVSIARGRKAGQGKIQTIPNNTEQYQKYVNNAACSQKWTSRHPDERDVCQTN